MHDVQRVHEIESVKKTTHKQKINSRKDVLTFRNSCEFFRPCAGVIGVLEYFILTLNIVKAISFS